MKFLIIVFLASTCWLLYDRANLTKEIEAANAKILKMDDLQKRFDSAQIEIARLHGHPVPTSTISGSPQTAPKTPKEDGWFKEALKPKIK